jgi:hypothetical protein
VLRDTRAVTAKRLSGQGAKARRQGGGPRRREGGEAATEPMGAARFELDPLTGTTAEVRRVQPPAARKAYVCPGCNQQIPPGVAHVVVVPLSLPGERRHWHASCWSHRGRRRPG